MPMRSGRRTGPDLVLTCAALAFCCAAAAPLGAIPGFRFKLRLSGGSLAVRQESDCIPETLCVSGALAGRSELFVRIVGPRPNGHLWPNVVKFTTSQVEVWIEQTSSQQVQYYLLPSASADSGKLIGFFDRLGFSP